MMCWDGLTAAQAARIGFGLCLAACAAVAVAVLVWEVLVAWCDEAGEDENFDKEIVTK